MLFGEVHHHAEAGVVGFHLAFGEGARAHADGPAVGLGSATALVVAIMVVAYALREQMIPILVLGVLGSLIATQALLATTITGAASALVVTTLGLIIVVAAIARGVRSSGQSPPNT